MDVEKDPSWGQHSIVEENRNMLENMGSRKPRAWLASTWSRNTLLIQGPSSTLHSGSRQVDHDRVDSPF